MSRARSVYAPRRVEVEIGPSGAPAALGGIGVEAIREEWVVEDRWWTERPLRRHYYELALTDGRCVSVFRDVPTRGWYAQRA